MESSPSPRQILPDPSLRAAQEAASLLGIGLSVLKRVCRTIGLARWPYRKRQSLRNVIEQTKLYLVRTLI